METSWKPVLHFCDPEIPPGGRMVDPHPDRFRHNRGFGQPDFNEAIRAVVSGRPAEMSGGDGVKLFRSSLPWKFIRADWIPIWIITDNVFKSAVAIAAAPHFKEHAIRKKFAHRHER